MFLSYSEKLENSKEVKRKEISRLPFYVKTKKERIKSIISFFVFSIIPLYGIIGNKEAKWIPYVIATIVGFVTLLLINIFSHSIYSKNRPDLCHKLEFIYKVSKIIVFINAIINFKSKVEKIKLKSVSFYWNSFLGVFDNFSWDSICDFKNIFISDLLPFLIFAFSVIAFIPVLIYFFIIEVELALKLIPWLIPIVNIVVYIKWLIKRNDIFVHYEEIEDGKYLCSYREITIKGYNLIRFFAKLSFSVVLIISIVLILIYYDMTPLDAMRFCSNWLIDTITEVFNIFINFLKNK